MTEPNPVGTYRPKGVVAVLDTSVLVRAWLSGSLAPNASRRMMLLAGVAYNSVTSPAILDEAEEVLVRPRFGADRAQVRVWLDAFVRASVQVFPQTVPGGDAAAVRGDEDDVPVLHTAYATAIEHSAIVTSAQSDAGCFVVSENTRDFVPGRVVFGWRYVRATEFLQLLLRRFRRA